MPNWWHDKSKTAEFEKGYIERLWFYNQTPQPPWGSISTPPIPC
jgi:microcin C transport system substrate-binding protein